MASNGLLQDGIQLNVTGIMLDAQFINVTVHDKTNHIALGLNLRYEPKKSPMVIIIDFHLLAWIDRGIIPLHKNLLHSF